MFTFSDGRQAEKRFWTESYQALPEFILLLISSWIKFLSIAIVPKYLKQLLTFWTLSFILFTY
jgi:hypothetical protein